MDLMGVGGQEARDDRLRGLPRDHKPSHPRAPREVQCLAPPPPEQYPRQKATKGGWAMMGQEVAE